MNKVVIVGAIVVIVAAIAAGVLLANHQNNNYTPTTTTTYTNMSVILNTNTSTPSTTTTSTSTSTTPTNTTTNTTTKIHYNTFYFLNQTGQDYYYVFVLSYNEYKQIVNGTPDIESSPVVLDNSFGVGITKAITIGNYTFLIGYIVPPSSFNGFSIGQQYIIKFFTNNEYMYWLTYEGNWEGPSL